MRIEFADNPNQHDIQVLNNGILANAQQKKGMSAFKSFAFFMRDEHDVIQGGCAGTILYGCCHVDSLWVDQALRHQGYGAKLMKSAEDVAKQEKCNFISVNTMDWEALDFYKKLGFKLEFERHGFDKNSVFYFLRKDF